MAWVVGVRFKPAGKIYHFESEDLELQSGDAVIVETIRGIEYGVVALGKREISEDQLVLPLRRLFRKAMRKIQLYIIKINKKKRKRWSSARQKFACIIYPCGLLT